MPVPATSPSFWLSGIGRPLIQKKKTTNHSPFRPTFGQTDRIVGNTVQELFINDTSLNSAGQCSQGGFVVPRVPGRTGKDAGHGVRLS